MLNIREMKWKSLEALVLENEILRVAVIPRLGGKIASFYHKALDFEAAAQNPAEVYSVPWLGADFSQYDASGMDDAFPNIDPGQIEYLGQKLVYRDHGDIWSSALSREIRGEGLNLYCRGPGETYDYEKILFLEENALKIRYRIFGLLEKGLPCLWTFHGLFRYEEDMKILYPKGTDRFLNVLDSRELGQRGRLHSIQESAYDFSGVPGADTQTMIKYYAAGKVSEGRCGYRYPGRQAECLIEYSADKLPYLGVWITAGGYRGDYNCALEPSTGLYDSVQTACENNSIYVLKKGDPLIFDLKISMKKLDGGQ